MNRNTIKRNFIEALMRLRRDSIIITKSSLNDILQLKVNNNIFGFNTTNMCWSFNDNIEWSPKVDEVLSIIENSSDNEILSAIEKMDNDKFVIFEKINAISLVSKSLKIFELMTLKENCVSPLPEFIVSTKNIENNYSIIYNSEQKQFEICDFNVSEEYVKFDVNEITGILQNCSYTEAFKALNMTYSLLNKK